MIPFSTFGTPTAPPLHFAHANGFPPPVYRRFLDLIGQQHRVTAVHHRPLWDDRDPWEELQSWRPIADDMIRFLDEQNARDIIGVGHSLGAVSTLYAAIERPEFFSKLIFIEPVFLPPEFIASIQSMSVEDQKIHNPMVKAALHRRNQWATREEAWERFRGKKNFARFTDAALWDYVNAITAPNDDGFGLIYPRDWEARFYSMPPRDIWELVPQLTHPTLAIRATDSNTLFPKAWALWQEKQPDATFIELSELGHLLMLENPQLVAKTVLNWLA